jgi:hypothetical protein
MMLNQPLAALIVFVHERYPRAKSTRSTTMTDRTPASINTPPGPQFAERERSAKNQSSGRHITSSTATRAGKERSVMSPGVGTVALRPKRPLPRQLAQQLVKVRRDRLIERQKPNRRFPLLAVVAVECVEDLLR